MPATKESSSDSNIAATIAKTNQRGASTGCYDHEQSSYFNHSAPVYVLLAVVCLTVLVGAVYFIGKVHRNKATQSRRAHTFLFRFWKNEVGESRER